MSTKVSTGLTLTADFFMRNFYSENRNAISTSNRKAFSNVELSYEDSRALTKAAKKINALDYSTVTDDTEDIDETMQNRIQAFVDTYNNTLNTADMDDHDTHRYINQLKSITAEHADELEDIGVTTNTDGTLEVNSSLLELADISKVRDIFESDSGFMKNVISTTKKLNSAVRTDVVNQVNTGRISLNIVL
ncbi:MAG: hypothetical protein LUI02_00320 [Clostridiales bacterium]|nr:hypothetical protein [Clostridiales bacterium]